MRDDSAEILFQSFLQETTVSSSGICNAVAYIQHFLRRPRRRPPSGQEALRGGSGEYVVPRDIAEPREFPSLNGQLPKEVPVGPKAALLTTVSYTMLGISSLS